MRRPAPLLLHEAFYVRQNSPCFRGDGFLTGAYNHGRRCDTRFGDCSEHVREQRTPSD
jgi:hypothetical protein